MALFPGGWGTQDENFETLTLVQTGKANLIPVVLCDAPGGTYWTRWKQYVEEQLLKKGMISPPDMNLLKITDDIDVAVQEILQFYRRYHSSRMVRDNLAIRLKSPIGKELVERLNDEFGDIITGGKMHTAAGPLSGEGDEFPDLQRLILKFDRQSVGRLRLMVDQLNEAE